MVLLVTKLFLHFYREIARLITQDSQNAVIFYDHFNSVPAASIDESLQRTKSALSKSRGDHNSATEMENLSRLGSGVLGVGASALHTSEVHMQ